MTTAPPLSDGAENVTTACSIPPTANTPVGAPGTVRLSTGPVLDTALWVAGVGGMAVTVASEEALDAAPTPKALLAVTLNV